MRDEGAGGQGGNNEHLEVAKYCPNLDRHTQQLFFHKLRVVGDVYCAAAVEGWELLE